MNSYSFDEVEGMAGVLLKMGYHPSVVRRRMAEKGIRWEYQYGGQGRRERLRRLRASGRDLCVCGQSKLTCHPICQSCLEKKWAATS